MLLKLNARLGTPHPECAPDEVFVGYFNQNGFAEIEAYPSKRKGTRLFDDAAVEVTEGAYPEFFPVFALASEIEANFRQ